jgi:nicotinamidase-related amidase
MEIDLTRTAVLAVHFENDVVAPDGAFAGFFAEQIVARGVIATAARVIAAARAAKVPVIYTRVGWDAGYATLIPNSNLVAASPEMGCLVNGTHQTEILPALAPQDGELVLTNERVSSFAESKLDSLLRSKGIDTVLIFGVATNLSVEDTARNAANLGYRVAVVEDACSAGTEAAHQASIESMSLLLTGVMSSAEVLEAFAA